MPNRSQFKLKRLLLVVFVLVGLAVALGSAYLYRAHRVAAAFRKFRADGLAADARGDHPRAVELLGQYLARYPNDLPALIAYSKDRPLVPAADNQNLVQAIQSLRYALRLDPTLNEQRRELMGLYVRTGYATEALGAADTLLSANPQDVGALAARTGALIRLRRLPEALTAAAAWTTADPAAIDAKLVRLQLLFQTQHPKDEATALADAWAKSFAPQKDGTADLLRGHALLVFGDTAGASDLLRSAGTLAVAHLSPKPAALALAADLDAVHQPDLALAVTQALWKSDPNDLELRLNLARRDWETQQLSAVADLIGGISDRSRIPSPMLGLQAVALLGLNRAAEIAPIRRELATRTDDLSLAWNTVITQMTAPSFNAPAVVAAALPVLDRQAEPLLRYFLGEAYHRLDEEELAVRQWQQVVAADPSWAEPAIRVCQGLTQLGRPDDAFQAGLEAVRRAPHRVDALVALASAWTSAVQAGHGDNAAGCLHLVEQLATQLPADGRIPPLHAALLIALHRTADAAAVIQTALASSQAYPAVTWEKLAAISESAGLNLQTACLTRAGADRGMTPTLAYAKAAASFQSGQPAEGLRSFDADRAAAESAHPLSTADSLGWSLNRALYLDLIHDPAALAAWQALIDAHPADPQVQQAAVSASCVRADRDTLKTAADRLGTLTAKQGTGYALARARWLVAFGSSAADADEARSLLDPVLRDTPESVDAHLLSARAYELAAKPAEAALDLRAAVDKAPQVASIRLDLARLLRSEGDIDAAREQLAHLPVEQLSDDAQRRQAAELLSATGQFDRAVALLQDARYPGNASNTTQLALAELYLQNNKPAEAEAIASRLLDQHPDAQTVQFEANLLANSGRVDQARTLLDRLSEPGTAGTANGVAELTRGDFALRYDAATPQGQSEALAFFAAATAAGPTNATAWHSRIAAELVTGHAADAQAVAADGLKTLPNDATLLSVGRHAAALAYAAAQSTLQPTLVAFVQDPADAAAPASTLELLSNAAATRMPLEVVQTHLRQLAEQFPGFAPLHVQLVQLDKELRQKDQAVTDAAQAVQALPLDPDLIRLQSQTLAEDGRWSEALEVAVRWHDRFPTRAADADIARAEALLHLNRAAEAVSLLEPYEDAPASPSQDRVIPTLARAAWTADRTDPTPRMTRFLSQGPAGRSVYMQFALTTLPPDEAEAWIRNAIAAMPPAPSSIEERITASSMYFHLADRTTGDTATRELTAAVEVLRPYLDDPAAPIRVLLTAAPLEEKLGHVDAAVELYRRVLAASPGQPMAENNLAMILARGGHADQALPLVDAAVKTLPRVSDLYDTRAFVLSRAGRTDDALAAIGEALRLDPARVSFHVRQIALLADANRTREAVDALHVLDSLSFDPTTVPADTLRRLQDLRDRLGKAAANTHGVT